MSEWYYAHGGQQKGPVPLPELQRLAEMGEFDPSGDLVWREGMNDWKPANLVEEIQQSLHHPASPAADPGAVAPPAEANPYAAPHAVQTKASVDGPRQEIPPGSQPIEFAACLARGFELTKRHFSIIITTGAVYVGISLLAIFILGAIEVAIDGPPPAPEAPGGNGFDPSATELRFTPVTLVTNVLSQVLSAFLGLGVTRIGLTIVDGKPASIGMMFGEGRKLLRSLGAGILYAMMVALGLIFLIVPGIYLALRFGQYQNAIVDHDMGVFDAFAYSSSITTENRVNLFILAVLSILIVMAGLLAFFVGLILAYPIVWLAAIVAYRWMQFGPRVAVD